MTVGAWFNRNKVKNFVLTDFFKQVVKILRAIPSCFWKSSKRCVPKYTSRKINIDQPSPIRSSTWAMERITFLSDVIIKSYIRSIDVVSIDSKPKKVEQPIAAKNINFKYNRKFKSYLNLFISLD